VKASDTEEKRHNGNGNGNGNGHTPEDWSQSDVIAYVGKGVSFKGEVKYDGTVKIDGTLEGQIETTGVLLVGADAIIRAKVKAGSVICRGEITGDIIATTKVNLLADAVVDGSVQTPVLSIEEGVAFNGTLEMRKQQAGEIDALRQMATVTPLVGAGTPRVTR
jgi:cytoskeletal protein CcmA (bactofilin family)